MMHSMYLNDMADALIKEGLIKKDEKERASKALGTVWNKTIAIVWSTEDVITRAKELDMDISEESAEEILDMAEDGHDAEYGITWASFDYYLEYDEYQEESKVRQAEPDELPLIMNDIHTSNGKELLEERLKEIDDGENNRED